MLSTIIVSKDFQRPPSCADAANPSHLSALYCDVTDVTHEW